MSEAKTPITNDAEFRAALNTLSAGQKREIGARFVDSVMDLNTEQRITRAMNVAHNPDASEDELVDAFKASKAAMIESRTRCGADCDWNDQAIHFVARAAAAVVAPEGQCKAADPLWQTVQSCRMARNCALIAEDSDDANPEALKQYGILQAFLAE